MKVRIFVRNSSLAVLALAAISSVSFGQMAPATSTVPSAPLNEGANGTVAAPAFIEQWSAGPLSFADSLRDDAGFLTGNRAFPKFIGFLSNPLQSIDPRAVTELWPMFGNSWTSNNGPFITDANAQIYGAGLYLALSERLSVGLNQGGYGVLDINGNRQRFLTKPDLPVPERSRGGQREGWLNLGGFVQYTLIADVPRQLLFNVGLRWEAPSGATQLFQGGNNPAYLAPYVSAGKEFGHWHILGTTGFEFPAGSGTATTNTFYHNFHIDRQFGWFYPLVELNGSVHTTAADPNLTARHGVLDLGGFSSTGSLLVLAIGANAVLVPGKLEFGVVYLRPIASQDHVDYNGMLVKMVYRY